MKIIRAWCVSFVYKFEGEERKEIVRNFMLFS